MKTSARILFATYGSRGDVAPFLALARRVLDAGGAPTVAGPGKYAPLAALHGVPYRALPGDPDELAGSLSDRAGFSVPLQTLRMIQHVMPIAAEALRIVLEASRDSDLVVHSFLMTEAGHLAARLAGVPDLSAQLFPMFATTSDFPAVAYPDLPLGGGYRRVTHKLNHGLFHWGGRAMYALVRRSHPDLPSLGRRPFGPPNPTPILFGFSPIVIPPPSDWPPSAIVTGYWTLPAPRPWSPEPGLRRFLDEGAPPVYFGVGSMRPGRLMAQVAIFRRAIRAVGRRGIVHLASGTGKFGPFGEDVFRVEDVPHEWLFPRMEAIIHHGGAGTTGAALRSGVPTMAVPVTADQAFWGRRLHQLGVGPPPVALRRWTQAAAEASLRDLTGNPAYRPTAQRIGRQLEAEDGIAAGLEIMLDRLRGGAG